MKLIIIPEASVLSITDTKASAVRGTHNGVGRADDMSSGALLYILDPTRPFLRSRNNAALAKCSIVFDVGGEFNAAKGRYDHHQDGYGEKRENNIPYSSFGLLWRQWGISVIKAITDPQNLKGVSLTAAADYVDRNLVQAIDAADCGYRRSVVITAPVSEDEQHLLAYNLWETAGRPEGKDLFFWLAAGQLLAPTATFVERTHKCAEGEFIQPKIGGDSVPGYSLTQYLHNFNPGWAVKKPDFDAAWLRGVEFMVDLIGATVKEAVSYEGAQTIIRDCIKQKVHPAIVELTAFAPFAETVCNEDPEALFVIFPDEAGTYRLQAVPDEPNSFGTRKYLPEAWAGKRDEELAKITGVSDATFTHIGRWCAGAKSLAGARELAQLAIAR